MIITKRSLPRRTFLRGVGATLSLPLLDAMVPALSALSQTPAQPRMRMGFLYVPNGIQMENFRPAGGGAGFEMTPILRPLEPYRDQTVVLGGLANALANPLDVGSGTHARASAVWLNGVRPKRTEGADIRAGTTIDQFAARSLGNETPLRSLELALEPNFIVGNCEGGYSCVYVNTFSWRTPTMPLPMETNPHAVFERLFGQGGDPAARLAQMRKDRSLLDAVTADMRRLQRALGPHDRATVDGYLDAVRDVERRLQKTLQRADASPAPAMEAPLGIPDSFAEHARLMFDLQLLAYQADITRVITFQIGRELSTARTPSWACSSLTTTSRTIRAIPSGWRRTRRSTSSIWGCSRSSWRSCGRRPTVTDRCSTTRCCSTVAASVTATGTCRTTCRSCSWAAAAASSAAAGIWWSRPIRR